MTSVYDSERLAAAYAFDRPPVHEQILRSARLARQADQALDVGCGAGLSTAALAPLARRVIGLEPIPAMLAYRRTVAPHASFVIGRAERLPFAAGSFDLVTAAGSLNYADVQSALAEIARVLTAGRDVPAVRLFTRPELSERRQARALVRVLRAAVSLATWLAAA